MKFPDPSRCRGNRIGSIRPGRRRPGGSWPATRSCFDRLPSLVLIFLVQAAPGQPAPAWLLDFAARLYTTCSDKLARAGERDRLGRRYLRGLGARPVDVRGAHGRHDAIPRRRGGKRRRGDRHRLAGAMADHQDPVGVHEVARRLVAQHHAQRPLVTTKLPSFSQPTPPYVPCTGPRAPASRGSTRRSTWSPATCRRPSPWNGAAFE